MNQHVKQYKHLPKRYNNRTKLLVGIMVIVVFLVNIVAYQTFKKQLESLLDAETDVYLEEISYRSVDSINRKVTGDLNMLQEMATILGTKDQLEADSWIKVLKENSMLNEFQRIGIILPNGKSTGKYGTGRNFADYDYFKQAMAGKVTVSNVLIDRSTNLSVITYMVPIIKEEKVIAVLSAVINVEDFEKVLSLPSFNGHGYSYIINNDGSLIFHSKHPDSDLHVKNIFFNIEKPNKDVDEMKKDMQLGKKGEVYYTIDHVKRNGLYEPIGINNWYLVTVVPVDQTAYIAKTIGSMTTILTVLVSLVLLAFVGYVVFEQNKHRKLLTKLAYVDEVTGVLNKNSFKLEAELLIKKGKSQYALLMLDIDKFKIINDIFGYAQGDLLLKHIAKVLDKHINQNEVFARIEGDKFYVLMEYSTIETIERRIEQIMQDISSFKITDSQYNIVVCAGIYVIEDVDISIDSMSDRANLANRRIKGCHNSSYFIYNDDIRNQLIEQNEIENQMKKALENKEFIVYLQPKFDLQTEKVSGAEALIRWQHPDKGLIPPDRFIPIFENNGFVTEVDLFVLEEICKKQKEWIEQGHTPHIISVNQSRLHLYNPNYVNDLMAITEKYQIDRSLIELELTETAVFDNIDILLDVTNKLREAGFRISIDDFGTGYSSLNMLKDINVDTLKLDREFFSETVNTNRSNKITENIINMSKDLDMKTVAEGVETKEQVEFLRGMDCNLAQGFYYARPMPLDEFYQLLKDEENGHVDKIKTRLK